MESLAIDIEKSTLINPYYRRVIWTGRYSQVVLMSLKPNEEIGMEVHPTTDQFIRIESGRGDAIIRMSVASGIISDECKGDIKYELMDGSAVSIPAGTYHNIINTGKDNLQLYTIYSPPHHPANTLHENKPSNEH